jgi:hypothetical protein
MTLEEVQRLQDLLVKLEAVQWANSGADEIAWLKFGLEKSEAGWRTLEFLAWIFGDMVEGGAPLIFFPVSPPPYLNQPGECLSFVVEIHPAEDETYGKRIVEFMSRGLLSYWPQCRV